MESIEKFLYTWQDDFLEDLDINEKNNLTYACYERIINYFIEYATIKNQVNLIERAIYDKTGDLEDLVDLNRFVFDA